MRKLISLTMAGVVAMGLGITLSGCSDESTAKKESNSHHPGRQGNRDRGNEGQAVR